MSEAKPDDGAGLDPRLDGYIDDLQFMFGSSCFLTEHIMALINAVNGTREEVRRLRSVCAEAYQMAGALGAPVKALDNLSAASTGRPLPHETFLPVPPATGISAPNEVQRLRHVLCWLHSVLPTDWRFHRTAQSRIEDALTTMPQPTPADAIAGSERHAKVIAEMRCPECRRNSIVWLAPNVRCDGSGCHWYGDFTEAQQPTDSEPASATNADPSDTDMLDWLEAAMRDGRDDLIDLRLELLQSSSGIRGLGMPTIRGVIRAAMRAESDGTK